MDLVRDVLGLIVVSAGISYVFVLGSISEHCTADVLGFMPDVSCFGVSCWALCRMFLVFHIGYYMVCRWLCF